MLVLAAAMIKLACPPLPHTGIFRHSPPKLRHLLPDTWAQDGQDMDEVLLRKVGGPGNTTPSEAQGPNTDESAATTA